MASHCPRGRRSDAAVRSRRRRCLVGRTPLPADIDKAAAPAQAAARPISDMRGDADYRRHLAGVLTKRALAGAFQRSKEN